MGGSGAGRSGPGRLGACLLAAALVWLGFLPLHAQSGSSLSSECGRSAATGGSKGKIFGGQKAGPERWPWQASLLLQGRHICGAALIDSNWVASAAHCFQRSSNPSDYRILLGYNQLSRPTQYSRQMTVNKLFIHPSFGKRHYMSDDITLLQLHRSVNFSSHIRPVCLPESKMVVPEMASCWITGWGMITEDEFLSEPLQLQEGEVGLIENQFCGSYFPSDPSGGSSNTYEIHDEMLCAGDLINGKSICRGDSGGPLVCRVNSTWFLVGLSSWSLDCRMPVSPSVFTRLTYFSNWVKEKKASAPAPDIVVAPPEEKPPSLSGPSSLGTVHRPGSCTALVSSQTLLLLLGFLRSL